MRPSVLPHNSMARSTAQSDGLELSTGTKISRYTSTSLWAGEYVNDETGCQVSGGTSCLPSESQTVMASTGQASHARSSRSRSTRSPSPAPRPLRERVVPPRRDHASHHFERLRLDRRPADLHAQRRDQLRLHRIRQQSDGAAALGAPERRRERAVAGEPPLLEQHLPVAFDAEELHNAECGVRNAECVMTSASSVVRARPRPEGRD